MGRDAPHVEVLTLSGFWLGIDYGTSNTVAMLRWPDGRVRPLLFDGVPVLPSAVFAEADGRLLVGRDAERTGPSCEVSLTSKSQPPATVYTYVPDRPGAPRRSPRQPLIKWLT